MKRILVATDGTPAANRAVETGLELAVSSRADVTFLHVLPPDEFIERRFGREQVVAHHENLDETEVALRRAARAAELAGVSYALERIAGDTVDEILGVADAKDVDLIVVGSRGKEGLSRFLGSVSLAVVERAERPVLIVKDVAAPVRG